MNPPRGVAPLSAAGRCLLGLSVGLAATAASPADLIFADTFDADCAAPTFVEGFATADGAAWPAPWQIAGDVALADVQSGFGRLRPGPTGYSLGRMKAATATRDVDVTFRFRLENAATQGVGFYVRQNGGYLTQTIPNGQGYAIFIEGSFRNLPGVGVWRETNGNEEQIAHSTGVAGPAAGTVYRARFQTEQITPTTTELRARFWPEGSAEPVEWQITGMDTSPQLQNISGGIAVDSWSVLQTPSMITDPTFVDDIVLTPLCIP